MACEKHKRTLDTFLGDYVQHTHPELVELSAQVDINIDDIDQNLLDIVALEATVGPNSGNWDSTYATVSAYSASWNMHTDVSTLCAQVTANTQNIINLGTSSGYWDSAYATVLAYSADWGDHTDVTAICAQVTANTQNIFNLSGEVTGIEQDIIYLSGSIDNNTILINNNITTIQINSGNIETLANSSGSWESTFSTVSSNSADWGNHTDVSDVAAASSYWNSTTSTVSANSGYWNSTWETVSGNSGNWDSTYTNVSSNSANWENARTDFGILSANPVGSPINGDVYFNTELNMDMIYDQNRSRWLSRETISIHYGRRNRVNPGVYFRTIDGLAYSEDIGFYAPHSGMIIGQTYTRSDNDLAVFEGTSDGVTIVGSTISSSSQKGHDMSLSGLFAPNTVIGVRNQKGGNRVRNVNGTMLVKWVT